MNLLRKIVICLYPQLLVSLNCTLSNSSHSHSRYSILTSLGLQVSLTTEKCSFDNQLEITEAISLPYSQAWAFCNNCVWKNGKFYVISHEDDTLISSTWSNWGDFFYALHNDRISLTSQKETFVPSNTIVINQPVFLLPILTFHPGHVLVDVLEQIYSSMISHYGRIRTDSLIVIDVANVKERDILQEKLNLFLQSDTFASVLYPFSSHHIISAEIFFQRIKNLEIVFEFLHLGNFAAGSFLSGSVSTSPCPYSRNDPSLDLEGYVSFANFLLDSPFIKQIPPYADYPETCCDILIIQRNGSRSLPISALLDTLSSSLPDLSTVVLDLDTIPFSSQIQYFKRAKVMVCAAGTAAHNMIFLNPNALVVVFMMPEWCDWAWMYVNQGALLGIKVLSYCHSEDTHEIYSYQWGARAWMQGNRITKQSDVSVDFNALRRDVLRIVRGETHSKKGEGEGEGEGKERWCNAPTRDKQRIFDPLSPNYSTQQPSFAFRCALSEVRIEPRSDQAGSRLFLMGELSSTRSSFHFLIQTLPHLTVCMRLYSIIHVQSNEIPEQICIPIDLLNYHASLILDTSYNTLVAHIWAQVSTEGGKVDHSDVYVSIQADLDHNILPVLNQEIVCELQPYRWALQPEELSSLSLSLSPPVRYVFSGGTHRHSLQHSVTDFAQSLAQNLSHLYPFQLPDFLPVLISSDIYNCVYRQTLSDQLPTIQLLPSPSNPFVFIHIEKTAGTTLREMIHSSCLRIGVDCFIPSQGGLSDVIFDLPRRNHAYLSQISAIAGHFSWGVWSSLPSFRPKNLSVDVPPCFIMGRQPVDRVISYYYQRCYMESSCEHYGKHMNDLSLEELRFMLYTFRQGKKVSDHSDEVVVVDEGMEDAACRAIINKKFTTGKTPYTISIPPPLEQSDIDLALKNSEKCVVGLQEDWQGTLRILQHWFPWVRQTSKEKRMQLIREESSSTLRHDLRALIEEYNRCDLALYEKMKQRFDLQIELISTSNYMLLLRAN